MNRLAQFEASVLEFETQRLRVRLLSESDEELLCGLYTDAETMRFIAPQLSRKQAGRRFHKAMESLRKNPFESAFLAIIEKSTQNPVGICAIVQLDVGTSRAEVGIMLKSEARSRGLASEGLGGLVGQTFRTCAVNEIWVECSARNPVVERMVGSIGFVLGDGLGSEGLSKRVWSVRRSSWCSTATTNRGEN